MQQAPQSEEFVTATVELGIPGATIAARLTVPAGPVRLSEMLETCRSLTGAIVGTAAEQAEAAGERISCKAGCGACCRQIVPVTEPEARAIGALVEEMPEPRRSVIRQRFAAARARLEEAGLLDQITDTDRFPYSEVKPYAHDYFSLGIPCPFLEDESCSIYEDRPLSCREYLVTSDPVHCAGPTAQTIRLVPVAARLSSALIHVGLRPGATHGRWVPLIVAPEWAAAQPEEAFEKTGPELLEEIFSCLARKKAAPPAESSVPPTAAPSSLEGGQEKLPGSAQAGG